MPDRLPPLRLTAAERRYLAVELDIAAESYEDCIHLGRGRIDPDARRTARRLRGFADRMRGGPASAIPMLADARSVPLSEIQTNG